MNWRSPLNMPELRYAYAKCNRTHKHCTINILVSSGNSHGVQIQNICSNSCEINLQCVFECVRTLRPPFSFDVIVSRAHKIWCQAPLCCAIPLAFVCSIPSSLGKSDSWCIPVSFTPRSPVRIPFVRCNLLRNLPFEKKGRIKQSSLGWNDENNDRDYGSKIWK